MQSEDEMTGLDHPVQVRSECPEARDTFDDFIDSRPLRHVLAQLQ